MGSLATLILFCTPDFSLNILDMILKSFTLRFIFGFINIHGCRHCRRSLSSNTWMSFLNERCAILLLRLQFPRMLKHDPLRRALRHNRQHIIRNKREVL